MSDSVTKNCAEAGFCCEGTNDACVGKGPTMSSNSSTGNCYCDEICVQNRDCCLDYLQTCSGNMIAVYVWMNHSKNSIDCAYKKKKTK